MSVAWVPQELSRCILHQHRWWSNLKELDMVEHTPISYPSGFVTAFQFCEQSWWSSSPLSTGIYGLASIPPPNACEPAGHAVKEDIHAYYTLLGIFTHLEWMLQLMSMGEAIASHLFHPREIFLSWCWVIARLSSSCGIALLWPPLGVCLVGVGLVHLSHTWQTPIYKEYQLLTW